MLSVMQKARLPKLLSGLLLTSSIALWSYGCAQPQKVPDAGSGYGEPISSEAGPEAPVESMSQAETQSADQKTEENAAENTPEESAVFHRSTS